jgi:23S rRNA pseudouridine1911/1915/1917 synthase
VKRVELVVGPDEGSRLDLFLLQRLAGHSRTSVKRLIDAGLVRRDGKPVKPSTRLHPGEQLTVEMPGPVNPRLQPEAIPLDILCQDPNFLVIAKPPGLVVHPGAGRRSGTLVNALLSLEGEISRMGGEERPGIVHRLDRETSGVLVVARNDAAHRNLAAQFAARQVTKIYLALVWGNPAPVRGRIEAPLGRHPVVRTRMSVRRAGGRPAVTEYETLQSFRNFSLLRVRILTGRTHQIRVHLKHLGHPVVGDTVYGGSRFSVVRDARTREALESFGRLALHALRLEFDDPASGQRRSFEAPPPADFERLARDLGGLR